MRVYRKITNFYARKVTRPPGPAKATTYGKKLMKTIENCPDIPLKDAISNAITVAHYYLRWCAGEQKLSQRKHYAKMAFEHSSNGIRLIEEAWGTLHTSKRSAELYEKGCIAAMLTRQSTDMVRYNTLYEKW